MYKLATNTRDFIEAFEHLLGQPLANRMQQHQFRTQMLETPVSYIIKAEIPGVDKSSINIDFSKDGLLFIETVVGQKSQQESMEPDVVVLHNEFKSYRSMRSFCFQSDVDRDNLRAQYTDGILTVTIPKLTQRTKAKVIIE